MPETMVPSSSKTFDLGFIEIEYTSRTQTKTHSTSSWHYTNHLQAEICLAHLGRHADRFRYFRNIYPHARALTEAAVQDAPQEVRFSLHTIGATLQAMHNCTLGGAESQVG